MVKAVEKAVGPIHPECVQDRPSSAGSYLSVKIGPVIVQSPEQVIAIFANMRQDARLKWYM
jgi:putative lipoic acid-binding regulatory protein